MINAPAVPAISSGSERGVIWDEPTDDNPDTVDGVREVPLRSIHPGKRFALVLKHTSINPSISMRRDICGTVIRHGPGTCAVLLDHAEKERSFTTKEGQVVVLVQSGGIVYWSPGTAVKPMPGERDITRWTTKGGTGVGLTDEAASQDELEEREHMATKERHAALPIDGATTTTTTAKAKTVSTAPKVPKVPKQLNACKDGCGEMVTGRFRQGHDARYYSILKKVAKGEMKLSEMPRLMQQEAKTLDEVKAILKASNH